MVSPERFREILDDIIDELPKDLLIDLNGGILLREEEKLHPESVGEELYIMGEYHMERIMGRFILLYYGSFAHIYGHLAEDSLRVKIRKTLLHEIRHHLESLAGEKDLEVEDAVQIARYKEKKQNEER